MKKIAIYKVVIGGYDTFNDELFAITENCDCFEYDYYFFSDKKLMLPEPWINIVINRQFDDDAVENRMYKINIPDILAEYDYTIYLDGNICITGDIKNVLQKIANERSLIFAYPHYINHKLKTEIISCYLYSRISLLSFIKAIWSLRNNLQSLVGYECGVLIRKKNTPELKLLAHVWFNKYYQGVRRDQFYFISALKETNVQCSSIGINDLRESSGTFTLRAHKNQPTFSDKLWIAFKVRAYNFFFAKRKLI